MYDVTTETTIKGTVESVETVNGTGARGRRALEGTHLVVKTDTETIDVHAGPTTYLTEKGIALATTRSLSSDQEGRQHVDST